MQKKNSNTALEFQNNLKLSIQFSLDGFSFCITNTATQTDVFFTEYIFDYQLKSPEQLLEKIEYLFTDDKNLQLDFDAVEVIHQNDLNTLVPQKYFDEDLLNDYLNYNIKTLKTDFIAFDELQHINANNVFIPYVNINNFLFQHFGEFEYKHYITVFIDKLLALKTESDKEIMYVNVSKNTLDIAVLKEQQLLFSNTFTYHTKEDFIYYILFVAEQLSLNTNEFQLYFTGSIHKDEDTYIISQTYIKNISFLESSNPIFEDLDALKHTNFMLLHQ